MHGTVATTRHFRDATRAPARRSGRHTPRADSRKLPVGRQAIALHEIYRMARQYAPLAARRERSVTYYNDWGPAHELAHALLSTRRERTLQDYGMCDFGGCTCERARCMVIEVAAMAISHALVRAAGWRDLALAERQASPRIDAAFARVLQRRARALLRIRGLWPIPATSARLRAAITRRRLELVGCRL